MAVVFVLIVWWAPLTVCEWEMFVFISICGRLLFRVTPVASLAITTGGPGRRREDGGGDGPDCTPLRSCVYSFTANVAGGRKAMFGPNPELGSVLIECLFAVFWTQAVRRSGRQLMSAAETIVGE